VGWRTSRKCAQKASTRGDPHPILVNREIGTVDIAAIITAVVNATTQRITITTAAHISGAIPSAATTLSLLKLLHLHMICGVAVNIGRGSGSLHKTGRSCKHYPTPNVRYGSLLERLPGLL
jgi:hypothetical protein